MPAVINTNVSALRAQNASRMASNAVGAAMERLSTGKRINAAKDDAARRHTDRASGRFVAPATFARARAS